MSKIYATQTDLTIRLTTGKDITGATSVKILYKNAKGVSGEWTASIENAPAGIIKYDIISPLLEAGKWILWAKVVDTQGLISVGEPSEMIVKNEGQ